MISQDTKDQIEKDALEFAKEYGETTNLTELLKYGVGYVAAATKYAEKLEEKDKEIEELKTWHDYYKERAEKGEGILKSATDILFIPGKEGDNLLAAKDRELAQLKEITKGMVKCIQVIEQNGFVGNGSEVAMNECLMSYTEWCKQNLK